MKKLTSLLIAALLLFSSVGALAAAPVTVTLNGDPIEFDVPAQIIDDRTMVPMRKIFETLGATVEWVPEQQGIIATRDSQIVVMKIGAKLMFVTDISTGQNDSVSLDVPPLIVHDRTLVPIRAISESLGVTVDWDGETRTVLLTR